jgi:hypothetical protein
MILKCLREPPPRCLTETTPLLLRPAYFFSERSSDFSGLSVVISSNEDLTIDLTPGDVGLYVFSAKLNLLFY